ncbi:MAG: OmpA family protein, partial [Moraxellaceae bacterium]|nr:OmpA family protein [Moraxellaceae bacterium]
AATPAGVQVDAQGCPLDGDKDGVADYQDKCPDTKAGAAVDGTGCYEVLKEAVSMAIDVKFATGKADIQGDASTAEIQKIVDFMQKYPTVNVTIEGHTDNRGNPAKNKQLSQKRADAVKAAVVAAGVDASRLSAVGYGADKPVADNNTEEGRAQNRRVVASAKAQTETIKMKR